MMDHAELDFGIYRIMNQKREEINRFLEHDLLPQVKEALQGGSGDADAAKKRMAEIEKMFAGMNIETLPESNPNVAEYQKLKAQLAQDGNSDEMQADVFNHLLTFFSRYYDGGDFISKRRYKDNTYAIPYNGEEVKLHWANSDQYYIKTSEYFRDYTFVLPASRRKVHFVLKDATTEQNNNKAANNMERRFALWKPENEGEQVVEVTAEGDLNIYFTYELMPKATKQKDLINNALESITPQIPADFIELLSTKMPTKDNANRTLLEKHLTDYTAKNSFDYFIHKDLGGFLSRELDFYIKNEVLHIDDLDAQHINSQLAIVKAIKQVGQKIIQMLAQLENFQKKLWLKKKFVVQSDYCITLDRVPEKLYPEIVANDAQRKEWIRLFAIDEIKGDLHKVGYSDPLTIEFLKQNPFLVLDTAFFDAKFKHQLVKSMENIDEQTNGLLINSENFQALELLQEKYMKRMNGIYIDPPYNTSASEIVYKNSYKKSSWASMIIDRINEGKNLLLPDGLSCVTIDDFQLHELYYILQQTYGEDNIKGTVAIKNNPSGRSTESGFSIAHEYAIFCSLDEDTKIGRLERTQEQNDRYGEQDDEGQFEWVNFRKHGGWKEDAPTMYYPIYITKSTIRIPKMKWNGDLGEYDILESCNEGETVLYPIDEEGTPRRWKWGLDRALSEISNMKVKNDRTGKMAVYIKSRLNDKGILPLTIWDKSEYSSTSNGANLVKGLFGADNVFSYPKSLYAVIDSLKVLNIGENAMVIDYFAGSGTTGHAVIEMNRADQKNRKYYLVEVNNYFDVATRSRVIKAIYSSKWRNGKPVSRDGISQCFKYIRLEQYEDTLNNLKIKKQELEFPSNEFQESYMLSYLLDTETRESLLNLKWFENPFTMTLKTTKDNELVETKVDMVETFNYLIGLNVETEDWHMDDNICVVQGKTHRDGLKTLVIWRNCKEVDNEKLCNFFDKMDFRTRDTEFDLIYVNGDNTLPNMRRDEEHWKVVLTEEEFAKRMFEEQ
jgi:adenine-specific DNA-methyltransferase